MESLYSCYRFLRADMPKNTGLRNCVKMAKKTVWRWFMD